MGVAKTNDSSLGAGSSDKGASSSASSSPATVRKSSPKKKSSSPKTSTSSKMDQQFVLKNPYANKPARPANPVAFQFDPGCSPEALKAIRKQAQKRTQKHCKARKLLTFDLGAKQPDHGGKVQFQLMEHLHGETVVLIRVLANDRSSKKFKGYQILNKALSIAPEPWAQAAKIVSKQKEWHVNDVVQKYPKVARNHNLPDPKIPIFLKLLPGSVKREDIDIDMLHEMGLAIAERISEDSISPTTCDKKDLFFGSTDDVWATTIGSRGAWHELTRKHNVEKDKNWYENNRETLHLFFKPGELPLKYAKIIGAPPQEVRESERGSYWELIQKAQAKVEEENHLMRNPPMAQSNWGQQWANVDDDIDNSAISIVDNTVNLDVLDLNGA